MIQSTEALEAQVKQVEAELSRLNDKAYKLYTELNHMKSNNFIEVNRITKNDVELSRGDAKPYFGHIQQFIDWMKEHSTKRWAEWNGRIYPISDLHRGIMSSELLAYADDVK